MAHKFSRISARSRNLAVRTPARTTRWRMPKESLGTWQGFQQKELHKDLLMAYGFGDGGGGPTREMLENIEAMKHFPALPQVRQSSAKTFFESIEPLTESKMMPVWNGELYLEYHRGTYTTQARNKRANRKSEFLLHDAEFICIRIALTSTDSQLRISNYRISRMPGARSVSTNSTTSSPARASVRSMKSRNSNMPSSRRM